MNIMFKKVLLLAITLILPLFVGTSVCQANSAPPPTIIIIVPNAPSDLEIIIEPQTIKGTRTNNLVESYFAFYAFNMKSGFDTVKVTTGDNTFEVTLNLDIPSKAFYTTVLTLDLDSHSLTSKNPSVVRSVSLLSLQIILTLIIEGIVFFLFGFRKKRSWLVFLILNLLTQSILFTLLALGQGVPPNGYIIFGLIFGEILVFVIEMVGFQVFIKESSRVRTGVYVLVANLASLIAGGFIIMALPVYF
jgi:hypothetical protein